MLQNKTKISFKDHPSGFSLTELLVVIVMFGILSTAAYNLFREQSRINRTQQDFVEMQSNARSAMQTIIKEFSHAGFGCTDSFSVGKSINVISNFIIPSSDIDDRFNANPPYPDSLTLVFGYKHIGNVTESIHDNSTIKDKVKVVSTENNAFATSSSHNFRKYISFYPSTQPNDFFVGIGSSSSGTTTLSIDPEVERLKIGAKVFRVTPTRYFVENEELKIQQIYDSEPEETLIFNVQDFQLAYSVDGTNWIETPDPTQLRNIKAIWIYLLLKSEHREPGYQESRNFTLPWPGGKTITGTFPAGFHYYETHSQIWLRNVL